MTKAISQERIDEIADYRERGWSYERIGRKLGLARSTISWHCTKHGIEGPKKPSFHAYNGPMKMVRNGHVVRRFTPEEDHRLIKLESEGLTYSQIARALGRTRNSVSARLFSLARKEEFGEA